MIRLNRESEAAASCQKQACEELKTVQSDLKTAEEELQHKQCMAEAVRAKAADSQHELSSLQRTLHALHAEVATAQQAHDEVSAQLSEARLQLEGRQMQFIRLSQDQNAISQHELDDQQIVSDLVRHVGSGHPLEAVTPSQQQQARSSVAGSVSNAGQMENLQVRLGPCLCDYGDACMYPNMLRTDVVLLAACRCLPCAYQPLILMTLHDVGQPGSNAHGP